MQRRRLALLALLAVARGRGIGRDKLIAWLWPESDTERARHLLSDSIYRIHQALGEDVIVAAGDEVRLDVERLPVDVVEFLDAMDRGAWEQAVELHRAPFLDGFFLPDAEAFERWADQERARFAHDRARALEELARAAETTGDPTTAVRWWRALAADDPFSSRVALLLMQALEQAGERAAAVRHARIHAELVRSELGVAPDPEVEALAERLRSAPAIPAPQAAASPPPTDASAAPDETVGFEPTGGVVGPGSRARLRARAGWVATAILVVAGLAAWAVVRSRRTTDLPATTVIAILPFRDLSPNGDEAYFADGMTEELVVRLSKVDGLRVMGRTSSLAFVDADVPEVARRLGVDAVLDGSVRRAGDRLRIVGQLVDGANGLELWSETYERELDDVFAIQDEIARAIVTRLRGRLAGEDVGREPSQEIDDRETYNLYLRGRYEWHRRTEESLRAAAEYFRQAVERTPDYARAWAGLGDAYAVLGFYDYVPPDSAFPTAVRAGERALQLDATLSSAHATLGYAALYHGWDFARAEHEFLRSIDLDPGYSTGRQWYANLLTAMGRFDEAEREMRYATELDPLSRIANAALGWVLYHAHDFDSAIEQCSRTLELDPDFELAHLWKGKSLEELGRRDEALVELRLFMESSGRSGIGTAALAGAFARAGMPDSARTLLTELEGRSGYLPSFEIAKVHYALGDRAGTFAWLQRALRERSHSMVFLAVDPELAGLLEDPEYVRLMQQVGVAPG